MDAIATLIERVAERIDKMGITERAASIEATGSPDAIRYIRSRRAMPSAARLAAIAKVLEATPEWLIGEADVNIYAPPHSHLDYIHSEEYEQRKAKFRRPEIEAHDAYFAMPTRATAGDPGIPIYATSRLPDGQFGLPEFGRFAKGKEWHIPDFDSKRVIVQQMAVDRTEIIGHFASVPVSPTQALSAYGIYLPINALDPAFPAGTPALVSRSRHAQETDIALFDLWRPDELDPSDTLTVFNTVIVPARIRHIHAYSYDVHQLRGGEFNIPVDRIAGIHRVYAMADLLR